MPYDCNVALAAVIRDGNVLLLERNKENAELPKVFASYLTTVAGNAFSHFGFANKEQVSVSEILFIAILQRVKGLVTGAQGTVKPITVVNGYFAGMQCEDFADSVESSLAQVLTVDNLKAITANTSEILKMSMDSLQGDKVKSTINKLTCVKEKAGDAQLHQN